MIKYLCKTYTQLSDADIQKLEEVSQIVPTIAELVRTDVFIDCLTSDSDIAVVVAQASPLSCKSIYGGSVVGELALMRNEPAVIRTLRSGVSTRDVKAITQKKRNVKQNVIPVRNDDNKVIGVLIMEQDITKNIRQNKQMKILTETTEQLVGTLLSYRDDKHEISNHVTDAILVFNRNREATYVNPVARELYDKLGYIDDILGMDFNNLVLDGALFEEIITKSLVNMTDVDIGKISLKIKYVAMEQKEKLSGVIMLVKDVSEVKEKEKELILKSMVMKEINHRVKNNLQTIASLLRLQSRRIDNESAKRAFDESINRILSIAVTHEMLAQNNIDDVNIKDIIVKIKDSIVKNGMLLYNDINITISGDDFKIDSDKATSVALVVNELLQNSLEHAFVGRSDGHIKIIITKKKMYSEISIIDNGLGFDMNSVRRGSLGFTIVKAIVNDKLLGHLDVESTTEGTKIVFDFKN